jgi:hypothetical protein
VELNVDTPIVYCALRSEYLYNLEAHHGEFIPCAIFGASSVQSRAIGFHCMLHNGALIHRMPISAFVHKPDAPVMALDLLELWDCLSSDIVCNEYSFLKGLRVDVILKNHQVEQGIYLFTLDWHNSSLADNPGEGGHKCAHVIRLNNGTFCAQPNNRLRWYEPSFITVPMLERPDYQTNYQLYSVENKGDKWATEDSPRMFYELEEERHGSPNTRPSTG